MAGSKRIRGLVDERFDGEQQPTGTITTTIESHGPRPQARRAVEPIATNSSTGKSRAREQHERQHRGARRAGRYRAGAGNAERRPGRRAAATPGSSQMR